MFRKEKEAIMLQEKINIQNEQAEMEQAQRLDEVLLQRKREEETIKKKKLREALHDQIITAHLRNQHLYEEFLKEKRYLDEIIKRIQDEHVE